MTVEPKGGSTIVIPAALYLLLVCLGPVVTAVLGLGALGVDVPSWVIIIAMCVGAALGPATGYSMPQRSPTQDAKAVAARENAPATRYALRGDPQGRTGGQGYALGKLLAFLAVAAAAAVTAYLIFAGSGCSLYASTDPAELEVGAVEAEGSWTAEDCQRCDAAQLGLSVAGGALVGLGASAPIILAAWPDPPHDAVVGIGVAGAVAGILGGAAAIVGQGIAAECAKRCTAPTWELELGGPAASGP